MSHSVFSFASSPCPACVHKVGTDAVIALHCLKLATVAAFVDVTSELSIDVNSGAVLSANVSKAWSCGLDRHSGYSSCEYVAMSPVSGSVCIAIEGKASNSDLVSGVADIVVCSCFVSLLSPGFMLSVPATSGEVGVSVTVVQLCSFCVGGISV